MAKLTEKRRRFVESYVGVAQGNATEAARRVGYANPKQQGARLLTFVDVQQAIEAATVEVRQQAIADREERQRWLTAIVRGETHEPHVTKVGEVVHTIPPHAARTKALELLGKMQGDFVEKHEVQHSGQASVVFVPDNGRGDGS